MFSPTITVSQVPACDVVPPLNESVQIGHSALRRRVRDTFAGMEGGTPSDRVIEQRIRNRIIEYLDLAASYEAQAAYQTSVPFVTVPYEVINQWDDWVPADPGDLARNVGVFSPDEVRAMCEFQAVLDRVADSGAERPPATRRRTGFTRVGPVAQCCLDCA